MSQEPPRMDRGTPTTGVPVTKPSQVTPSPDTKPQRNTNPSIPVYPSQQPQSFNRGLPQGYVQTYVPMVNPRMPYMPMPIHPQRFPLPQPPYQQYPINTGVPPRGLNPYSTAPYSPNEQQPIAQVPPVKRVSKAVLIIDPKSLTPIETATPAPSATAATPGGLTSVVPTPATVSSPVLPRVKKPVEILAPTAASSKKTLPDAPAPTESTATKPVVADADPATVTPLTIPTVTAVPAIDKVDALPSPTLPSSPLDTADTIEDDERLASQTEEFDNGIPPAILEGYKQGFWNPATGTGIRHYSTEFLKCFAAYCMAKPVDMKVDPNYFKQQNGATSNKNSRVGGNQGGVATLDFLIPGNQGSSRMALPGARTSSRDNRSQPSSRQNSQNRGNTQKSTIALKIGGFGSNEAVLQQGFVRGKDAFVRRTEAVIALEDPEQLILREALGILNKLTLEKFDSLSKKLIEKGTLLKQEMRTFMKQIFNKACDEPFFCKVYARLCKAMSEAKAKDNTTLLLPDFRKLLLNLCQDEFQSRTKADSDATDNVKAPKAKETPAKETTAESEPLVVATTESPSITAAEPSVAVVEPKVEDVAAGLSEPKVESKEDRTAIERKLKEDQLDREMQKNKAKRMMLGNIEFIGELFKVKLVSFKIMHECVKTLLKDEDTTDEATFECLCKLLDTAGGQIEKETEAPMYKEDKKKEEKTFWDTQFQGYFETLTRITKRKVPPLPNRIKFMIQDVIDLRRNKWVNRRVKEGPKKIDEIQLIAELDQNEKKLKNIEQRGSNGPPILSNVRGGQKTPDGDSNSFITIASRKSVDPARVGGMKKPDENQIFGSRPNFRVTAAKAQAPVIKIQTKLNMFHGLNGLVDSEDTSEQRESTNPTNASPSSSPAGRASPTPEVTDGPSVSVKNSQFELKIRGTIEEYVATSDSGEVLESLALISVEFGVAREDAARMLIQMLIQQSFTNGDKKKQPLLDLTLVLVKSYTLNDRYKETMLSFLTQIETITEELDAPKAAFTLAQYMAVGVVGHVFSVLDLTPECLMTHLNGGNGSNPVKMVIDIISEINKRQDAHSARRVLKDFGGDLRAYLPERLQASFDLNRELEKQALQFLLLPARLSMDNLEEDVVSLLAGSPNNNDAVISWIQSHNPTPEELTAPAFIRGLTRATLKDMVAQSTGVDQTKVDRIEKLRCLLLKKYSSDTKDFQFHIVCAIQSHANDLQFPKDFIHRWFTCLYDNDVVFEEVFIEWTKEEVISKSDAYPGKNLAVMEATNFITQLTCQEEEADETVSNAQ